MCPRLLCLAQAHFPHLMCALPSPSPKPLKDMVLKEETRGGRFSPLMGTSPPIWATLPCPRRLRITAERATHFLWPGDRLSHTAPLLAAVISGSSACHIRKRQQGPHSLGLTFLCLLEAEEIHRVQITHFPLPRKSGGPEKSWIAE